METQAQSGEQGGASIGSPVFTKDGKPLGTVMEVRGPYFKVAAPHRRDYWLQQSVAQRAADGRVTVEFVEHDLDDYEVHDVGAALAGEGEQLTDAMLLGESGTGTDQTDPPGPLRR